MEDKEEAKGKTESSGSNDEKSKKREAAAAPKGTRPPSFKDQAQSASHDGNYTRSNQILAAAATSASSSFDDKAHPRFKDQARAATPPPDEEVDPTSENAQNSVSVVFADARIVEDSTVERGSGRHGGADDLPVQIVHADDAKRIQEHKNKATRRVWLLLLLAIALVSAVVVGAVCGTGQCGKGSSTFPVSSTTNSTEHSNSTKPPLPTILPTVSPTTAEYRVDAMVDYVNRITFSTKTISYPPPTESTAQDLALEWLIEQSNHTVSSARAKHRLTQAFALSALWYSTNGDGWIKNEGWLSAQDECVWFGITCQDTDLGGDLGVETVVSGIDLRSNSLIGTLPPDIALLRSLTNVGINANGYLSGRLPSSVGELQNVERFSVSDCSMTGSLPSEMSRMSRLSDFFCYRNQFVGPLPEFDGSNLERFEVWGNAFTGLPQSIGNWSNLLRFDVSAALDDGVLSLSPLLSLPPHARFNQLVFCRYLRML